jgi:UDP-3-O-[3-hydroxymyristoyl] glucosamine N-acyltransferase
MPFTTQDIASRVGGELHGPGDVALHGVNALGAAVPGELTFIGDARHTAGWATSKASAALVKRGLTVERGEGRSLILVDDADLAMAQVLGLFAPQPPQVTPGVHPTAVVDATATLGIDCRIGPHVYVGPHAKLGDRCILHANASLLDHATLGDECVIWPGAVVRERCTLGRRCIVHPNAVIGSDGFGYRPSADGSSLVKVPQIGTVRIGDDVEIGAGTCIDRAKFAATVLGDGCKIDNLVQIGHNCVLGRCVIVAGQAAIAGSVTIGDGAIIGGAAMIPDHVTIGAGARVAGASALISSVPPGETWAGYYAQPRGAYMRQMAMLRRLPELVKQLRSAP